MAVRLSALHAEWPLSALRKIPGAHLADHKDIVRQEGRQPQYFSESLVAPAIEPGPLDL
jgi:hypothetical protein